MICVLLTCAAAYSFADQPIDLSATVSDLKSLPEISPPSDRVSPKKGHFYVRFTAAEGDLSHADQIVPGLGIGYRKQIGNGAADISASGLGLHEDKSYRWLWTFPKASYLYYFQPNAQRSAYAGCGIAWGGINERHRDFVGLIPSVVGGFEYAHNNSFLGFAEMTVSQPTISVYKTGSFPGTCVEISTGFGF